MAFTEIDRRLHEAISARDLRACRRALKDGANPDSESPDFCGQMESSLYAWESTPLLRAIGEEFTEGALLLIDSGATITAKDERASIPLEAAARLNRPEICRALLAAGAPADEVSRDGNGALLMAAVNGHPEPCRVLLEHGANVNLRNKAGQTPVMFAARTEHGSSTEVLRLLLAAGATTDAPGKKFPLATTLTAFQSAIETSAMRNVALFLEMRGEDPEQMTKDGRTMFGLTDSRAVHALLRAAIAEKSVRQAIGNPTAGNLDAGSAALCTPAPARAPSFGAL